MTRLRTDPSGVDLVSAIANNRRDRLAQALQRRNDSAALFGLADGKDVEAVYQVILPMGGPEGLKDHSSSLTLGPATLQGTSRLIFLSDNAGSFLQKLWPQLTSSTRYYALTSTVPSVLKSVPPGDAKAVGDGFRYRVPVSATTTLAVFKAPDMQAYAYGPVVDKKVVAQYGPIAALPSSFKGKGGRILVKHWPDSGGLQTVEIGAEALPSTAVTDVVGTVADQVKARRDKAAAAAAAAAAADPELDALTRQQKILALQKQIKDLEAELAKKEGN